MIALLEKSPVSFQMQSIPVGTPVTRCPPDRSQRAELPHWAPALGNDAHSLLRIRVSNIRIWKVTFNNAGHPVPINPELLASAPKRFEPKAPYIVTKGVHGSAISGDTVSLLAAEVSKTQKIK
jgi:hypothetical protein